MKEPRLTREQMLEARLAGIEDRLNHLENWTGADTDDGSMGEQASMDEILQAQEITLRHLFMYLELLVPGFSVAQFRQDLRRLQQDLREDWSRRNSNEAPFDRELIDRSDRIIDHYLPKSLYDDGGKPTGPFPADLQSLIKARSATIRDTSDTDEKGS